MVPRAYTIVGVASSAVLATLVAAGLSTGPILGPQQPSHPEAPAPIVAHPPQVHGTDSGVFPTWLTVTLTVMLALYAVGLLVLVALHKRGGDDDDEPDESPEDDIMSTAAWRTVLSVDLGDAAVAQLAVLHRGTPRNAIVACWLGLHTATIGAGLSEVTSETSEEYLVRAVRILGLDPPAITVLASLYREARFSAHVMVEDQRHLAEQSLRTLADQLARRPAAPPPDRLLARAAR